MSEKTQLKNTISESERNNDIERKARNRMVSEGYKYSVLKDKENGVLIDPLEERCEEAERKRWQKIKALLALAVILIAGLVIVVLVQHFRGGCPNCGQCTTQECVMGAAYILNKMDASVDPCTDFYLFSCGNWIKKTPFPPSKTKYGSFGIIADEILDIMHKIMNSGEVLYKGENSSAIHKTFQYYAMCMNEVQIQKDGVIPALKLIKSLGSWTLTSDPNSGQFDPSVWTVQNALTQAHKQQFSALFDMSVGTDEKNNSKYIIKFEQAGLTLNDRKEYFSDHSNYKALKEAFLEFAKEIVRLLGGEEAGRKDKVASLYDFEQKLANIHMSKESLIDPVKNYHNMTLQEFQSTFLGDWLDLKAYVTALFSDVSMTVPMDTVVIVYTPDYFKKLQQVIKDTNKETLANYVVWQSVQQMIGYLGKEFETAALILDKVETGVKEYPTRWKRCLTKDTATLGFALGAMYIQDNFANSSKKEVKELLEEIRAAFISNLDDISWMDASTRDYAKVKAAAVTKMLGYPDYIADRKKLDQHYENLTLVPGKFFETRLSVLVYGRQKNLRHLGTQPDRAEWLMVPEEVNGYYSPDFNHIVFPAGILRPPLYNPTSPKSFNFGSFGTICGHELTHGFDNKGRNFDKSGNMASWWTESSTAQFTNYKQCFIDYYSNFTVDGTHLNGETTQGENIADNGGMKMAYLAWKKWESKNHGRDSFTLPGVAYTPDQLFFIGMAQLWCSHYTPEYMQQSILRDVHSIAKFRVLGTMPNSKYFAKAFQCPKGSLMNPEKKCEVW
ncbi:endothelin-converting enzyme homolog isoform X2 [Dreissena polymorpha]|uniref:endothelin-converting enzyme homolog isoform X2 n=1 Tax=Dreissena polymorpha TaxID=45954 RepID=UPI002263DC68|nr:endothelin-converting enzyme homolog isoform X2 [Dreissena polymorpha]XP_052219550.1 endothelin-converting enzyme homolog isoform X2 [Dreissena polymorpha]XP_052219551.1 endothelin-converting enzyme homolog isoform X2 [Dreissena polymorpha]XP_052219552.1 endothelin-converting enzyme homolog isoform X2 [Dreissena polymorpha]